MKRRINGLGEATQSIFDGELPDGSYLVEVCRFQYRWGRGKPFYLVEFSVVQPTLYAGQGLRGRIYCTAKALWKLSWFLKDFQYDCQLLGDDELDEKAIIGLRGVVKISHRLHNGVPLLNLEAFAPETHWEAYQLPNSDSTSHEMAS